MLNKIEINRFRKFNYLEINDLKRVNLILGSNNSGKTSILESIFTYCCGLNIDSIISNVTIRGDKQIYGNYDFLEKVISMFNDKDNLEFKIKGEDINGNINEFTNKIELGSMYQSMLLNKYSNTSINSNMNRVLNWKVESIYGDKIERIIENNIVDSLNNQMLILPNLNANFNDILSHRNQKENTSIYANIKRSNLFNEFKENMKEVFGDIEDIDSIPYPDGTSAPVSIKYKDKELLPLYNFGDGHQRWFYILGNMMIKPNSIFCIEEIDSTFHYGAQRDLSKNIMKYSKKFNSQVFITSHSIEFVDNFLKGISELDDSTLLNEVNIITLKSNSKGETKARILNGEEAIETRINYGLELM